MHELMRRTAAAGCKVLTTYNVYDITRYYYTTVLSFRCSCSVPVLDDSCDAGLARYDCMHVHGLVDIVAWPRSYEVHR